MHQPQRDDLRLHRPGGGWIGELGQQGQKQQEDLGVEATHADALEGPVVPCPRAQLLAGIRCGGMHEQLDAKPEQVGRPYEGEQGECDRVACHQGAHPGGHDQDGDQVAEQQSGHGGEHDPAAHAGRDRIGPIYPGRDHKQDGNSPEGGKDCWCHEDRVSCQAETAATRGPPAPVPLAGSAGGRPGALCLFCGCRHAP
ncbi:hypothetical protein D3C84_748450 [compost metagenome]